jgi:hypothetical protein
MLIVIGIFAGAALRPIVPQAAPGPGYIQRNLLDTIQKSRKPLTFNQIVAKLEITNAPPSVIRSTRRALLGLVDDGKIIAIGRGGPREPFTYTVAP